MAPILTRLGRLLGGLLRWWLGALAALAPRRLRRGAEASRPRLEISIADGQARLRRRISGKEQPLGTFSLEPEDANRTAAELGQVLRGLGLTRAIRRGRLAVALFVPAEQALRRMFRLPAAAENDLREVIAHQIERETPFRVEEVHFACDLRERDARTGLLAVELAVVPRAVVASNLAALRHIEIEPDMVVVAGERDGDPASGNVLPPPAPQSASRVERVATAVLVGLCLVLAGFVLYLPMSAARATQERLDAALADAKRMAAESAKLRTEIEALAEDGRFLADRKRRAPTVSQILQEVTHLLPDGNWLIELEVSAAEIQLSGFATNASALISLAEQSPLFSQSAFRSPVMQDTRTQRERFNIAARLGKVPAKDAAR